MPQFNHDEENIFKALGIEHEDFKRKVDHILDSLADHIGKGEINPASVAKAVEQDPNTTEIEKLLIMKRMP